MEYKWSEKELQDLKNTLLELKHHPKCLSKPNINNSLKCIKEMEDILHLPKEKRFSFKMPLRYVDKTKFLPNRTLKDYQNIPQFMRKWLVYANYTLHYSNPSEEKFIPKINLTNEEVVTLSHDFYEWIPNKNYIKVIENYLDKTKHTLYMKNKSSVSTNLGLTFPFYYPTYKPFILIEKTNTIEDFCTLNHELAHSIYMAFDYSIGFNEPYIYLLELEGYFFDFLSFRFLKENKIIDDKTLNALEYNEIVTGIESITKFYFYYLSIYLYFNENKITIEQITEKLLEHDLPFFIDEYTLYSYLKDNNNNFAKYAISFLTSLDLEKMAQTDLERAFYNFERIRYNKTVDIKNNLTSNGITFMSDGYENLKDKIAKLNLTKK